MASYTTGKVGGAVAEKTSTPAKAKPSSTPAGDLSERMATLAGAGCLETTPVKYHMIRFALVLGVPLVLFLATGASVTASVVAKVLVWSITTEVAGFGGADGQLGDGHTLFTPLWFRLTPGTLRQSPFADPAAPVSGRLRMDVVLMCATLATAAVVFVSTGTYLTPAVQAFTAAFTLLCLRDYSAWCGGQGKHFYPMLLAAAFGGGAGTLPAMQVTQWAQIFFSGLCKMGPWWISVVVRTRHDAASAPCPSCPAL